jgi:hypothetical protein
MNESDRVPKKCLLGQPDGIRLRGTWSSSIRTSKNTKSPVGREKLRIPPGGSKLFGRHTVDRLEGHLAWPSCMYVLLN